ncbi:MAG TPA: hypothetical protein GXX25_12455 [Desulfotomaculum sp.]|nr:hypothetical protein [Desulfotomaculum sp.]
MTDREFLKVFRQQKEAFLKDFEKGTHHLRSAPVTSAGGDYKKVLDWFERWLREERVNTGSFEVGTREPARSFDQFMDEVLAVAREKLGDKNINITYSLPGQRLGISESWKCIKAFGSRDIYYRIGRTRPRKGPRRGEDLLVIDLVMDGYKKQVFLPLLAQKEAIERELGETLEREPPKVETTGKYRLKLLLPFEVVLRNDVHFVAEKLADFIAVTKPVLNGLGVM